MFVIVKEFVDWGDVEGNRSNSTVLSRMNKYLLRIILYIIQVYYS